MITEKRKRGRPPLGDAGMTEKIFVRAHLDDKKQLTALSAKLDGFDVPAITRAAFRLGMTVLELDPSLMLPGIVPVPAKRRAAIRAALKSIFVKDSE
jgi:hypothetical protein